MGCVGMYKILVVFLPGEPTQVFVRVCFIPSPSILHINFCTYQVSLKSHEEKIYTRPEIHVIRCFSMHLHTLYVLL